MMACVALMCFTACNRGVLVSHYESFDHEEWAIDSVKVFDFHVTEEGLSYDMVLGCRHTTEYPFQNIWLFTELYADTLLLSSDTLEYYLADRRGRWLGNGTGRLREMPMLYKQNLLIPDTGVYRLEVRHGMRREVLAGMSELGLTVEKASNGKE